MARAAARLSHHLADCAPPVSPEEMRLLQELIEEHCGVTQGLDSTYFVSRRVGPRLEHLGLTSVRDYYHYLKYDAGGAEELEIFVDQITTHETYFFREQYQLDAFCQNIVPEVAARSHRRQFTVWSAGCSTGEEVYTLAMLLSEHSSLRGTRIRIVGTDISKQVVRKARDAIYGQASFRTTPPEKIDRYFELLDDGRRRVKAEIRRLCSFGHLNLLDTERFGVFGRFDAILCRNVLMYFAPSARLRVVDAYYDVMTPGGYLLLGHSESLLNVSTRFDLVHLDNDLVYRKGKGGRR